MITNIHHETYAEETVGALCDMIDSYLADAARAIEEGNSRQARRCAQAAWREYLDFGSIVGVYAGESLRERVVNMLIRVGIDPVATRNPRYVAAAA